MMAAAAACTCRHQAILTFLGAMCEVLVGVIGSVRRSTWTRQGLRCSLDAGQQSFFWDDPWLVIMLAAGPLAAASKHQGPSGCRLYLAAAEQGYPPAMCRVAACYHQGQGCLTDAGLARYWYRQVRFG